MREYYRQMEKNPDRQLDIVVINGERYYSDPVLKQYRHVNNPHRVLTWNEVDYETLSDAGPPPDKLYSGIDKIYTWPNGDTVDLFVACEDFEEVVKDVYEVKFLPGVEVHWLELWEHSTVGIHQKIKPWPTPGIWFRDLVKVAVVETKKGKRILIAPDV